MLPLLLLAPVLFNTTGIIDTFLTKLFKKEEQVGVLHNSVSSLMIIGGLVTLVVSLILLPFVYDKIHTISLRSTLILILGGVLYGLAARPYFKALYAEKIENIIPILQTIPLFSYILGVVILNETISPHLVVIMILIVLCTGLFSRDVHAKKRNTTGFFLTIGSSLMYGLSFVLFKAGAGSEGNALVAFFWEHVGVTVCSLLFAVVPRNAKTTYKYLVNKGSKFTLLNIGNEMIYIAGIIISNYLSLSYPVAVINTISNGLQPLIGFVMVRLAYRIFPKYFEREYTRKHLLWKIILCVICFALLRYFFHLSGIQKK